VGYMLKSLHYRASKIKLIKANQAEIWEIFLNKISPISSENPIFWIFLLVFSKFQKPCNLHPANVCVNACAKFQPEKQLSLGSQFQFLRCQIAPYVECIKTHQIAKPVFLDIIWWKKLLAKIWLQTKWSATHSA